MSRLNNNTYANFHKGVSNEEVLAIFENQELYVDEARLAAYRTLKERGFEFSSEQLQEAARLEQQEREAEKKVLEQKQQEEQEQEVEQPLWYSPAAVLGFSIIGSVFIGSILLAMNFYRSQQKNRIPLVVLFGVLMYFGSIFLWLSGSIGQIAVVVINAMASIVLMEFFWKRFLGIRTPYERRSIWPPIGIIIGVTLVFAMILGAFITPEMLQEFQITKG